MTLFLAIVAIIGLLIFIVGAVLHLFTKPPAVTLMVVGGLIYAVAQVIMLFDAVL
jgi:hypothetical protein